MHVHVRERKSERARERDSTLDRVSSCYDPLSKALRILGQYTPLACFAAHWVSQPEFGLGVSSSVVQHCHLCY